MRDHHEFARLLKITDKPDGYSTAARTEAENKALTDFVCPLPLPPALMAHTLAQWTSLTAEPSFSQVDRVLQEPSGAHLVPFWVSLVVERDSWPIFGQRRMTSRLIHSLADADLRQG